MAWQGEMLFCRSGWIVFQEKQLETVVVLIVGLFCFTSTQGGSSTADVHLSISGDTVTFQTPPSRAGICQMRSLQTRRKNCYFGKIVRKQNFCAKTFNYSVLDKYVLFNHHFKIVDDTLFYSTVLREKLNFKKYAFPLLKCIIS